MSDLVQRLRADNLRRDLGDNLSHEAADHIELLEKALRAARDYMDAFGCDKDMAPTMELIESALGK